jgi:hypothetical protein
MKQIGFTGTQTGMTKKQKLKLKIILRRFVKGVKATGFKFHHGDCVGADEEADKIAKAEGGSIVQHPPKIPDKRAFCLVRGQDAVRPKKDYLPRNRDIVKEGKDLLLSAPKEKSEPDSQRAGGTWYTTRHARDVGRKIIILWP